MYQENAHIDIHRVIRGHCSAPNTQCKYVGVRGIVGVRERVKLINFAYENQ